MKICLQVNEEGKVVSWSEAPIQCRYEQQEVEISETDKQKLINNELTLRWEKGEMISEKSDNLLHKEKKEKIGKLIDKVRKGSHTNEELADLLTNLLDK